MSLFDFLTKDPSTGQAFNFSPTEAPAPVAQQPDLAPQATPAPGLLQQATPAPDKPGLLERFRTPDDHGVSWADRLYAIGGVLGHDEGGGMAYLQGKQKDYRAQKLLDQAQADRTAKNAAFKAAYANGKFDPGVYAAHLGGAEVDPSDIAQLSKTFAPQGGVEGGRSYTKDPSTGAISWGDAAPPTVADQTRQTQETERERHNQILEELMVRGLGIKQQGADANTFRAHKAPASGAAPSWLPPGARVVHVPGT